MGKKVLTDEHVEYIKARYKHTPLKEIGAEIGLSYSQVHYVVYSMFGEKLRSIGTLSRTWSEEEIEILRDPKKSDYEKYLLLKEYGRTEPSVRIKRKRLGFDSNNIEYQLKYKSKEGYIYVKCGSKYIKRARIVMETILGRQLKKTECVHHINGDKLDDSPENLYLCSRQVHNKIHHQANKLLKELFIEGLVDFDRKTGKYFIKRIKQVKEKYA